MQTLLTLVLFLSQLGPAGWSSIEGTVERLANGERVARAQVLLTKIDGRLSDSLTVTTDDNGRFTFSGLAPGSYRLFATRDGYVRNEFGQRTPSGRGMPLNVTLEQQMKGVVVTLTPTGTITGRVLSSEGAPLRNVAIKALKSSFFDGERIMTTAFETNTNDLGEYRLHTLTPGAYWIRAVPARGSVSKVMRLWDGILLFYCREGGFVDPRAFSPEQRLPAYFPGVPDLFSARSIEVRPGEVFRASDLVITMGRGARVRGQTINGVTNQPFAADSLSVNRISNDGGEDVGRNTTPDPLLSSRTPSPSFEFSGLPPGSYVLTARSGNMVARLPLEIRTDIDNLRVVLRPPQTVTGRVQVEGNALSGAELNALSIRLIGNEISPATTPSCDGTCRTYLVSTARARVTPDRAFVIADAPPGTYKVELLGVPPKVYIKTVRVGTVESSIPEIRVEESTPPLEIVLSNVFASFEAKVSSPAATVVLVPEFARKHFDRYRTAVSGPNGQVRIEGIVPGNYKVFAWEDIEPNAWENADVMKGYEDRGTAIRLDEGGVTSLELQVLR